MNTSKTSKRPHDRFDDLLALASDLLFKNDEIRTSLASRYTHILVVEFQHTHPTPASILRLLAGEGSIDSIDQWDQLRLRPGQLFLVGDPKQAIYRFRGADLNTYFRAKAALESTSENVVIEITTNFRSVEQIVDYVNSSFDEPFAQEGQPGLTALHTNHKNTRTDHVATFEVEVGLPEAIEEINDIEQVEAAESVASKSQKNRRCKNTRSRSGRVAEVLNNSWTTTKRGKSHCWPQQEPACGFMSNASKNWGFLSSVKQARASSDVRKSRTSLPSPEPWTTKRTPLP